MFFVFSSYHENHDDDVVGEFEITPNTISSLLLQSQNYFHFISKLDGGSSAMSERPTYPPYGKKPRTQSPNIVVAVFSKRDYFLETGYACLDLHRR